MAKGEIRQKIVLQGEKEYNAAIKEAQRNLKTLQSEMKAETAELGKNATAADKARVKQESLRKQIDEQQKIVETYTKALKEVTEAYGENSDEVHRWEQRLNNARTTLANMRNGFDDVNTGLQGMKANAAEVTVATKAVADSLKDIGKVGDAVSDAIEGIFSKMISTVSGAVSELWELISSTAAKANNWTDIASYWGTDAQTIQKYSRALQEEGKSLESLQTIVTKLVMGGKGKKITELIGISDENWTGNQWEYAMRIMDQLSYMQTHGQNMTPIYEEIFGEKKSVQVMDIVNAWEEVRANLETYDGNKSGYGMNDQELQTMNDLYLQIAAIETKWDAIKDKVAAGLGVGTMDLLVNVEGVLDGIADYFVAGNEEEKEAALTKIRENIEAFFRKLREIIGEAVKILNETGQALQKSDDPITRMIGDILVNLTNALQWMIDNQDKVKLAFEAIFGIWLLGKLAAVAGSLAGIIAQIEAIKAFKGVNFSGGSPTGGTGPDPTTTVNPSAKGTGAGGGGTVIAGGVKGALSTAAQMVAAEAAVTAVAVAPAVLQTIQNQAVWKAEQDKTIDLIERVEAAAGANENTQFVREAAIELGPTPVAGGGYKMDATGLFYNMNPTEKRDSLLMGLATRNAQQKAELHEAIKNYAPETDGWNTWELLNRYWEDQDLDLVTQTSLLANVSKAMEKAEEAQADPELARKRAEEQAAAIVEKAAKEGVGKKEGGIDLTGRVSEEMLMNMAPGQVLDLRPEAEIEAERQAAREAMGTSLAKDLTADFIAENEGFFVDAIMENMKKSGIGEIVAEDVTEDVKEVVRLKNEIPGLVAVVTDEERALYEAKAAEEAAAEEMRHDRSLTEEQVRAIEGFWDFWRQNETASDEEWNAAFDAYEAAFAGQTDLFDKVEELMTQFQEQQADKYGSGWTGVENLPSSWWDVLMNWSGLKVGAGTPNQDGITRADIQGFAALPQNLQEAVLAGARAGVSGIRVSLDGYTVGQLVAPYVSEQIAKDLIM